MWFYSVVFILLMLFNGLAYLVKFKKTGYVISLFFLMIMAAFRPSTCCADYNTYVGYYYDITNIPITFLEPTYFVISWLSKVIFNAPIGMFIIYSVLGITFKGAAIFKLTKYYTISLLFYFCSFFLLHEMTQIRVGVAAGILLLSIPYIKERNAFKFFLLIFIGSLFHYSLLVFAPFYFITPGKINKINYICLVVLIYIVTLAGVNFFTVLNLVNLGFLSTKIAVYQELLKQGINGEINLINPLLYLRICILFFFIINYEMLLKQNKYGVIFIKIYAFSILSFVALSALPVLAGRISQLLGVIEIILVPCGVYILKPKYLAVIIFVSFGLLIMYKQLYYSDLMSGYF